MADTLTAIAALLWPLLLLVLLLIFRQPVTQVLHSAVRREWTLEIGGQKITMKQLSDQQNTMIADLQRQIGELTRVVEQLTATSPGPREALPPAPANSVLWVDDHPANNALLIEQLQDNGIRVDLARSTAEGLARLGERPYGLIISDMGRQENGVEVSDAGLRLLRQVRALDRSIPFVIYSGGRAGSTYSQRALDEGATEATSSPGVLTGLFRTLGLL